MAKKHPTHGPSHEERPIISRRLALTRSRLSLDDIESGVERGVLTEIPSETGAPFFFRDEIDALVEEIFGAPDEEEDEEDAVEDEDEEE